MRFGVVSSADLLSEDRWDAGFHLTKKSLVEDGSLERTRAALSAMVDPALSEADKEKAMAAKAFEIVMSLPAEVRNRAVVDLVRGKNKPERAVEEYPIMSMAIAFRDGDAEAILNGQIEELQARADKIAGLGSVIKNKP